MATRRTRVAAVVWGFAEGTLFFIVPDVLLSYIALRRLRPALAACLFATAGALGGGVAMYAWGTVAPDAVVAALDHVPAVSSSMLERVAADLEQAGLPALFVGPFVGRPYKVYAALAPAAPIGLLPFLAVSVPARLLRFALVSTVVRALATHVFQRIGARRQVWVLTGFWILFYALFLTFMPS